MKRNNYWQRMYEEASQVANDAVGSIRTVASFCAEEKVMKMYKKKCEGPMRTGIRQGIVSGIGFGVSFFVLFSSYAASFYAGARLVDDGKTTFDSVFRVKSKTFFFQILMIPIFVCPLLKTVLCCFETGFLCFDNGGCSYISVKFIVS